MERWCYWEWSVLQGRGGDQRPVGWLSLRMAQEERSCNWRKSYKTEKHGGGWHIEYPKVRHEREKWSLNYTLCNLFALFFPLYLKRWISVNLFTLLCMVDGERSKSFHYHCIALWNFLSELTDISCLICPSWRITSQSNKSAN